MRKAQVNQFQKIAAQYHRDVHAAQQSSVAGEPEAQLTTPVSVLFRAVAHEAGQGTLSLVRESRLDKVRPDFAVLHAVGQKTRQKGYIELKAPDVTIDATKWSGRNAKQWESMKKEAEVLIVCNGREARLFQNGEPAGPDAVLPYENPNAWDSTSLVNLLRRFLEMNPRPVTSVRDLSERLAHRTADLRDRLLWLIEQEGSAGDAARGGFSAWKKHVHPESSTRDFADGISQVVAYGMVLAALSEGKPDDNGYLTVGQAREAIRAVSPVMAAAFAPLVDKPALFAAVEVEIGALESLVSAIDRAKVEKSADPRGETWLYFYEDFLSTYDPEERKQAGVYYTPVDIVHGMVRIVDHILVERFEMRLGFADPKVVTLDPATGTGTFPLAVLDRATERAKEVRGKAGPAQAAEVLSKNLYAFELLPGAYAVANLRLAERLKDLNGGHPLVAQVVLTDTLESPLNAQSQLALFGDAEVLAAEQNRAKRIKAEQHVTVVIGNPPYRRVEREIQGRGSGGWVLNGDVKGRTSGKSLFDDILDVARKHTNFAHHASLYNLYVYFWRWAIWKAFEAHGDGNGVVSFITGSSWLTGPGFIGLRQLVREVCDEAWVLDLGGDNHGASPEENVFAIETPVSVVVLVRNAKTDRSNPAKVHYRRVRGTAAEKLAAMKAIGESNTPLAGEWTDASAAWMEPFFPPAGGRAWQQMPQIVNLFPWQQPGCKFGRTWPIAPQAEVLLSRWNRFTSSTATERPDLFVTATAGRNITTSVAGMTCLVDLKAGASPRPMARYAYRSFDRQWALNDPRLAKTESPSLWASSSNKQIFLTSLMTGKMSEGPCITVAADVPDLHYFCGRGGKDIIPLYRDAAGNWPNVTLGLLEKLGAKLQTSKPTPEDLAAYVYALLSSSRYQELFAEALQTPGPHVPMTQKLDLWNEAVSIGRELLWLHTYAERFRDPAAKRGKHVPLVNGVGWDKALTRMPETMSDIVYEPATRVLNISDGRITGVRKEVWDYSVSGMPIVKKWLGYRTAKGAGRSASSDNPLDQIRPTTWPSDWNDELLDLLRVLTLTIEKQSAQNDLLDRICDAPLIRASDLPQPKPAQRKPPKVVYG